MTPKYKSHLLEQERLGYIYKNERGIYVSKEFPQNEKDDITYSTKMMEYGYHNRVYPYHISMALLCKYFLSDNLNILEVGAGDGTFAALLCHIINTQINSYTMYEFSNIADLIILKNFPKHIIALIEKATFKKLKSEYLKQFNVIIANEIFEHINWDLEFIANLPSGSKLMFTVPTFYSQFHVRCFPELESVHERYDSKVYIRSITPIGEYLYGSKEYPRWWCVASEVI